MMKVLAIAQKNLLLHFRSAFSLVMMFVAPLLVTGLLYLAFGNLGQVGGFNIQPARVQVANLDQPAGAAVAVGEMVVHALADQEVGRYVQLTEAGSAEAARSAVERQQADVALIIPADFSRAALAPAGETAITMIYDPAKTLGPAIVRDILSQLVDGLSGARIAVNVMTEQFTARGVAVEPAATGALTAQYVAWIQAFSQHEGATIPALALQSPPAKSASSSPLSMVGMIMAGMLIFFVFFTGANAAEMLIKEDEERTLARLFSTPTSRGEVLAGYLLSVFVTLLVQSVVLLVAASLLFSIRWGQPATIALTTLGMAAAAGGFGLLVMSLVKTTRQAGPVIGVVLTMTGAAGGLMTTGFQDMPAAYETINLLTPHGWALRAWRLTLAGAAPGEALLPIAVLFALAAIFFTIAVLSFRRRFA